MIKSVKSAILNTNIVTAFNKNLYFFIRIIKKSLVKTSRNNSNTHKFSNHENKTFHITFTQSLHNDFHSNLNMEDNADPDYTESWLAW